ncbi:MAG: c-type cytochrome [Lautropia sp.]
MAGAAAIRRVCRRPSPSLAALAGVAARLIVTVLTALTIGAVASSSSASTASTPTASTGSADSTAATAATAKTDSIDATTATMASRALACTGCHGAQGRAAPDGYYPRLAGKPAPYLLRQLRAFRDGDRRYRPMERLLRGLPDAYLRDFADYFSAMDVPYPPPAPVDADRETLARGQRIAKGTDGAAPAAACAACHGDALLGDGARAPGLTGLSRDYLNAQLGAWRTGQRRTPGSGCMARVVDALAPGEVAAVTAWIAAQPVAAPPTARADGVDPQAALRADVRRRCDEQTDPVPSGAPRDAGGAPAGAGTRRETPADPGTIARGRYLARLGHCAGCHSRPGGRPFAGGPALETPFGTFFGPNLTPDPVHGIGRWSADDFHRALHEGRSRDGRALYPAFPYQWYSGIRRQDSDALFAYLRSLDPVAQPSDAHRLRFPASSPVALWLWRALWFDPAPAAPLPGRGPGADPREDSGEDQGEDARRRRGAYLGEVLGHCGACHSARNVFGAPYDANALDGAPSPAGDPDVRWLAPSLRDASRGAVATWRIDAIARWLRTGQDVRGVASGPMGEVVHGSLQYATEDDALALASWLRSLPPASPAGRRERAPTPVSPAAMALGERVYGEHCADCHGRNGQGSAGDYPALAGNRQVTADDPANVVAIVRHGGFAPATAADPRPPGMPPFMQTLDARALAAVVDYVRNSWGNSAPALLGGDLD